ncbi:hypothetical protein [Streptomyces blattellae]|uniref:hypothetical protein n=1 Tax=Streptomyces blattellae TaxID=2569855 RepID=UPI001E5C4CE1|nr:hypothetical protein [Streptomyces blattellae]
MRRVPGAVEVRQRAIKERIGKLTEGLQKNTDNYREVETSLEESFKRAAAAGK